MKKYLIIVSLIIFVSLSFFLILRYLAVSGGIKSNPFLSEKDFQAMPSFKKMSSDLQSLQKELKKNPENKDVLRQSGDTNYLLYKNDEALKNYQEESKINPDDPVLYDKMGNVYAEQKLYSQAIETYRKSIELSPKNNIAYFDLANLYSLSLSKYDLAVAVFEEALISNPGDLQLQQALAFAYENNKQLDRAKNLYNQILLVDPNNLSAKTGLERVSRI